MAQSNPARSATTASRFQTPCPGGPSATQNWNRDAIVAERAGFDCSKGHPAQGNYHHHQNPSAFKLDINVLSSVCNLYDADGLYAINANQHSPLIGFAYDGFPIYGAYGYKNADGTGGIVRIKSSYQLRNITTRTHWADGTDVPDGPAVNTSYPLGYFREDYEFVSHTGEADYLDVHNGRFCVTPEYPQGTYCYFATVDANWNSAYPYIIGPTYYGVKTGGTVTSVTETVTTYEPSTNGIAEKTTNNFQVFPNPASELLVVQADNLLTQDVEAKLYDLKGKLISSKMIYQGTTITYFDVSTLYKGVYFLKIADKTIEVVVAQ